MGTTILESKGTWMQGLDRHTYWILPLHILAQAAWYRAFGFSLLALRWLSISWGAVILAAIYLLVSRLFRDPRIGLLAVALLAVDSHFIFVAALGRMDAMCAGLGWAGCAAFVGLRKRTLPVAIFCSNALVAASCLTHPCGALYLVILSVLILHHERGRLGLKEISFAAIPYLTALAAWSLYAWRDPAEFLEQFTGNVSGIASEFTQLTRWSGLRAPLSGFRREIGRYLGFFEWHTATNLWVRSQVAVLIVYFLGILCALCTPKIRRRPGSGVLLLSGVLVFVIMALLEGLKAGTYIIHTLPIASTLLAASFAYYLWPDGPGTHPGWSRPAAVAVLALFLCLQLAYGLEKDVTRRDRWDYDSMLLFLTNHAAASSQITGSAELAFRFGFDANLIDDPRLGYYSGRRPDFVVANTLYRAWITRSQTRYPKVYDYIQALLSTDYEEVFHNSSYSIYQRIDSRAKSASYD